MNITVGGECLKYPAEACLLGDLLFRPAFDTSFVLLFPLFIVVYDPDAFLPADRHEVIKLGSNELVNLGQRQ